MMKYGDVQLLDLNEEQYLVIACDSCGGIGNKVNDVVNIELEQLGYINALVPVMEVLAIRGRVCSIVNNLCVEMEPSGRKIIKGIKSLGKILNISEDNITGSTEDNIPTTMTAMGITIIGIVDKTYIAKKRIFEGDVLIAVGIPKVGDEYLEDIRLKKQEVVSLETIMEILKYDYVQDMIPVGSKGIKYEANVIAKRQNLRINMIDSKINYNKSAGPASVMLVVVNKKYKTQIIQKIKQPTYVVGEFY